MRLLDRFVTRNLDDNWGDNAYAVAYAFQQTWGYQATDVVLGSYADLIGNGYTNNSTVFGIESTRTGLFSEARFKYRSLIDKKLTGNTSLTILENPWPNGNTSDLLMRMLLDADCAGTSFTRRCDDGYLEQLRPDWCKVASLVDDQSGRKQVVAVYYQRDGLGQWEEYLAEDVVIWAPKPDPSSHWRGTPWLGAVKSEIQNDWSILSHIKYTLKNAGTPNLVYKYTKKFKDDTARQELQEKLDSRSAGAENAGKTLVLDDGADVTVVGSSLEALQFTDLSEDQRERIAGAAGVPALLAGVVSSNVSFGSDYAPAMRFLADITLRHLWRSAAGALEQFVDVPDANELWFDTSDIAALQSGEKEAADVMAAQIAAVSSARMGGATYESAVTAVSANDINLLVADPQMISVQLHQANPTGGSGNE